MSVVEAFDPNEIRLSDNAVSKVRALVEDEGNFELKLRVYITGGGCSGFQYGFSFDEAVSEDRFRLLHATVFQRHLDRWMYEHPLIDDYC